MRNLNFKDVFFRFTLYFLFISISAGITSLNIFSQGNSNLNNNNTKEKQQTDNANLISVKSNQKDYENKDINANSSNKNERIITQTNTELVEADSCECAYVAEATLGFPIYGFFAIGGGAFVPIFINEFDEKHPSGPTEVVSPSSP